MPDGTAMTTRGRAHAPGGCALCNEMPQHRLGHFEIRDDAVLQRPHGDDVGGRAAEHPLGFVADRQHLVRARLHRDHRRFAQNDALILDVNQRVGRAEIDPDVAG